jgi:hypothetical protein
MTKPFQFSMWQLLLAMAFFCLAAWSFSAMIKFGMQGDGKPAQLSILGLFVFVGAGIGTIAGRPLAGIGWALLLLFLLGLATSIFFTPQFRT